MGLQSSSEVMLKFQLEYSLVSPPVKSGFYLPRVIAVQMLSEIMNIKCLAQGWAHCYYHRRNRRAEIKVCETVRKQADSIQEFS